MITFVIKFMTAYSYNSFRIDIIAILIPPLIEFNASLFIIFVFLDMLN